MFHQMNKILPPQNCPDLLFKNRKKFLFETLRERQREGGKPKVGFLQLPGWFGFVSTFQFSLFTLPRHFKKKKKKKKFFARNFHKLVKGQRYCAAFLAVLFIPSIFQVYQFSANLSCWVSLYHLVFGRKMLNYPRVLHFIILSFSSRFSCPFSMGHCWTKLNTGNDENSQCPIGELASRNVCLVTTVDKWEEKLSEANKDGKIVVVNFSASWCNPCRFIAPAYNELADKYPSMVFVTVDVDQLAELSNSWEIKATPTIFFLKDGRQVDKLVGANKQELQKKAMAIAESYSGLTGPGLVD